MSYEKKIKDLMARLVSMAPEPPPFPEEMQMASPREQKKTRPALVFAVAAALVAILAIPLLLFTGGEESELIATTTTTTTTTTVPSTSTTPAPTSTTTLPGSTTTTVAQGTVWAGVGFLYQEPENSFGGNPALVPLDMEVTAPPGTFSDLSDFTRAMAALAASGGTLPEGFSNAIPPDVLIQSVDEVGGQLGVDMNEAFLDGAGGLLADYTMLNQLIYTLTWEQPDVSVLFTVNGDPVEVFGSEGLSLAEPVTRDSFIDGNVNSIFLTEPLSQALDQYHIVGRANTFEASLTVRVVDGDGEVVHEEPIQATCGTGCWGEFSLDIDSELVVPGESSIQLFQYSAEDGSPADVITIPVPEGGVWELAAG